VLSSCSGDDDDTAAPRDEPAASVEPYDPDRPYWEQGNFAPVQTEVTETSLEVTGAVPSALSGLYIQNGSNPPSGTSPHWFLGDGMVHGLRIRQGEAVWYRNRWINTTLHQRGQDFADAGVPGRDINQSNASLIRHADKLLSLGEIGWPYELSPRDLTTIGVWDFDGRLATAMTAHPKIDPDTGQMHFFGYGFTDPLLTYHVADADGRLVSSEPVAIEALTLIHDFAITDRDVVFWQGPVVFGTSPDQPYPDLPFYWDPDGPCQVGVMPLRGPASEIRWVSIDPCMVFHGLNAHRDGDDVVVRVNRVASAFGPEGDQLPSYLTEWRIDTSGDTLRFSDEQLSDIDMDLPTIDRRFTGRPCRDGWFATVDLDGPYGYEFSGLCHRNQETGDEALWVPGPMERAGEGFFVADGHDEGTGWLLTFLYDRTVDRSSLGIFDAQAVADGPVARIHLPVRVPYGFHGLWLSENELA
jgi:carotenoid cleavage dioxygenase-like enzyme